MVVRHRDDLAEDDEAFRVVLSALVYGDLADGEDVATVLNNDVPRLEASKIDALWADQDSDE